jgi:hypothetical protein
MRGLDPRIHPASQKGLSAKDCRVKPGNDDSLKLRYNS